jgi:hypothetical protein
MMNTQLHNFMPTWSTIVGAEAALTIDGPFNMPGNFSVRFPDGTRLAYEEPAGAHFEGLHYEAAAVARAIRQGSWKSRSGRWPNRSGPWPWPTPSGTSSESLSLANRHGIPKPACTSTHPSLLDSMFHRSLLTSGER